MSATLYFAQDPTSTRAVAETLAAHIENHVDLYWAALIDGAFDYPPKDDLPYIRNGLNCFDNNAYEGLMPAAPWLIPLLPGQQSHSQLKALLKHCSGRPMLSFVAGSLPVAELSQHWEKLHWVDTPDNQRMLLRLADTRVLPMLPKVLASDQWSAFAAPLQHWYFINREGRLSSCPLPNNEQPAHPPLHLSQNQLNALVQAAEPDAVIDLLMEQMQDIVPLSLKKSEFYALVSEACGLGCEYGVESFPDTVSLAVAACLSQGQSSKDPRLAALLRDKKWKGGELGTAIVDCGIV